MYHERPCEGIRAISLATNVPGPVAAARLAALGADVVKVEPPAGDFLARSAPAWYRTLVESQRVIALDLKSPGGRDALRAELERADILILSNRPSALRRMGLEMEELGRRFPRLCVVSIVGHASPDADRSGHDLTYQAEAGLLSPPALPVSLFSDLAAAAEAVTSALALLVQRGRTGAGGWREVSLANCAKGLAAPFRFGLTSPGGALGGAMPGYALYDAKDGPIAVAALEPHFLERLLKLLQLSAPDHAAIAREIRLQTVAHWTAMAAAHDIPIVAVNAVATSA